MLCFDRDRVTIEEYMRLIDLVVRLKPHEIHEVWLRRQAETSQHHSKCAGRYS